MTNPHLSALAAAQADLDRATEARFQAVEQARAAGVTWRAIADALGVTERAVTGLMERRANRARRADDR